MALTLLSLLQFLLKENYCLFHLNIYKHSRNHDSILNLTSLSFLCISILRPNILRLNQNYVKILTLIPSCITPLIPVCLSIAYVKIILGASITLFPLVLLLYSNALFLIYSINNLSIL